MIDEFIRDIARLLARSWLWYRGKDQWLFFMDNQEVEVVVRLIPRRGTGWNEFAMDEEIGIKVEV
jgi:hypothetical protein